jgi:DNA-binding MarR family transcriptional regulator
MPSFNPKHRYTTGGQITIALYRIMQAMAHLLRERGKDTGLSPAQIQALLFLKYVRPGARTIGGLAQRLAVTYATASGVADALERKRLVRRAPEPEDQRVVTLGLTPEGQREVEALEDVLDEIEAAVNALPEAEQSALLRATQAIVRRLQRAGYVKVYEMCWHCQFFRQDAHPSDPRGPHHCAFMDAPLPEPDTYLECPDFVPAETKGG